MTRYLVLQVLGNSDVRQLGAQAKERGSDVLRDLGAFDQRSLQEAIQILREDVEAGITQIDFPLIERLHKHLSNEDTAEIYWMIILTDQVEWMNQNEFRLGTEGWRNIVTSDGCWWRSFLEDWFNHHNYSYSLIDFSVNPVLENGVADWDGMAKTIAPLLNKSIEFKGEQINLKGQNYQADQILIQHSSGTPALSSALYLWGIEQKLAGQPVKFAYLSVDEGQNQEKVSIHQGSHWQWRLKKPQVMKLLEIQDFSGAIKLLGADYPDEKTLKDLQDLDKRSAFNLRNMQILPEQDGLERIAIALWTERILRQGGQWANWCLRVAGAMELALFYLVEQRGQEFKWKQEELKVILDHHLNSPRHLGFRLGIEKVVTELLKKGQFDSYTVEKIQDDRWQEFCDFYRSPTKGWKLDERIRNGFLHIRNMLYHSLAGDRLDQLLDQQTEKLGGADHPDHPAHKAVGYLLYLLKLGNLKTAVMARRDALQRQEREILTRLENLH